MRRLIPHADIVMPNITEGCLLTGISYSETMSEEMVHSICEQLTNVGAKKIVMTSVPCTRGKRGIVLYENGQLQLVEKESLSSEYHGTGDTFDGVLIGAYLNGHTLAEALELAHQFVYACMLESDRYDYEEREGLIIERNLGMLV